MILIIGMGKTGYDLTNHFITHFLNQSKTYSKTRSQNHPKPLIYFFDTRDHPTHQKKIKKAIYDSGLDYLRVKSNDLTLKFIESLEKIYLSSAIEPQLLNMSFKPYLAKILAQAETDLDLFISSIKKEKETNKQKIPIIAITGTNGKSSICQFLAELFKQAGLNAPILGNFGPGFLPFIKRESQKTKLTTNLNIEPKIDAYILELSSFQLFYAKVLDFDIGVISNLSQDHLDWHSNYSNYLKAKFKVFQNSKTIICPQSIHLPQSILLDFAEQKQNKNQSQNNDRNLIRFNETNFLNFSKIEQFNCLSLIDKTNHSLAFEVFKNAITEFYPNKTHLVFQIFKQALSKFKPLDYRNQKVATIAKVDWINDSKSTNPHSLIASVKSLINANTETNLWLIIGGNLADLKGINFQKFGEFLACEQFLNSSIQLKVIAIYGDAGYVIKKDIQDEIGKEIKISCFANIKKTVEFIFQDSQIKVKQLLNKSWSNQLNITQKKKEKQRLTLKNRVLFSPGCASLSTFKNYVHRGEVFNDLIQSNL